MSIDGDIEGGQVLDQAEQDADQIEVRRVACFHFVGLFWSVGVGSLDQIGGSIGGSIGCEPVRGR